MFDHTNPVCRLFAIYMMQATLDSYTESGCEYIVNRFYDHVELYKDDCDAYTRAQWKVPVYADWFKNMERHYELAEERRIGETGQLLYRAEMVAADMPVDFPLFVRKDEQSGLWKLYRRVSRGVYVLVPQYARVIGFTSKTRAEKCARKLERI